MNLSETYKRRLQELGGITNDSKPHNIIMIRSKTDKNFIWDIYYHSDNKKIYKIEGSGKQRDVFTDKAWLDFTLSLTTGEIVDFDKIRRDLPQFPELYVKYIM